MLCDVCFRMLRGQDGRVWKGTFDLHFQHHLDWSSLRRSAKLNCGICRVLHNELHSKLDATTTTRLADANDAHTSSMNNQKAHDATRVREVYRTTRTRSSSPSLGSTDGKDPRFNISAMLSVLDHPRIEDLYRLDFKLHYDHIRSRQTFILQKINSDDPPFRTQLSRNTSSDEVYTLVLNWMNRCSRECKSNCGNVSDRIPNWYPARLISLEELKKANSIENNIKRRGVETPDVKVRLVETKGWESRRSPKDNRYVTLSHCWGQGVTDKHKLTSHNIGAMKAGISLNSLPKTFQEAIIFAARLPRVGYIWIDSLCIKQGLQDHSDWLEQSASMYRVYSETFLNISATWASDSQGGLFKQRTPGSLLEDEVTLNIQGLPGAHPLPPNAPPPKHSPPENIVQAIEPLRPSTGRKFIRLLSTYWFVRWTFILLRLLHSELGTILELNREPPHDPSLSQTATKSEDPGITRLGNSIKAVKRARTKVEVVNSSASALTRSGTTISEDSDGAPIKSHNLKRCTILDASFWSDHVDNAAVNRRAWVLQERLMSPRVLHFCHDQVAWECCGFDAAEGQPEGMPNFQLTSGGVVEESRLKGLVVRQDGKRLRKIRLQGNRDPDMHMRPKIYALELWRRIVEVYSKTAITNDDDKLIALSGMAKLMAEKIGSKRRPAKYAAGLWEDYLASQLLWRVEPVWRELGEMFDNLSVSPKDYRAPSWSWASVNAEKGHGVAYADITDRDLYIKIEKVSVKPRDSQNIYGIVESKGTYLDMWGKLRKAVLYRKEPISKGRFGWRLVDRGGGPIEKEEHTNVYLDCPADDAKNNMSSRDHRKSYDNTHIYVIPAAMGARIVAKESKYLTCLLVQHYTYHQDACGPAFKRIGTTKLSPWADSETHSEILEVRPSDVDMPHLGYDSDTGMHRIRLV